METSSNPKHFFFILFQLLLSIFVSKQSSVLIVDYCDRTELNGGCGAGGGKCIRLPAGTRCQCPDGWMGKECKRPCQDVHNSCGRWERQGRCQWHKTISPFFLDNCALSCHFCRPSTKQKKLNSALSPLLEPMAWLIGRWETRTLGNRTDRFPAPMSGPYFEILDVQIGEAPAFDRPSLNISVRAWAISGDEDKADDEHWEVGFLTVKPAREQTGFVEQKEEMKEEKLNENEGTRDLVALELVSNTGVMAIEEGQLAEPGHLELSTQWHRYFLPSAADGIGKEERPPRIKLELTRRTFLLVEPNLLEERIDYVLPGGENGEGDGRRRRVMKRFRKVHDYLT